MKEVWVCRWEVFPGDGEHRETYTSLAKAKLAMRQIIAKHINLTEYLSDVDPQASDFLTKYLSDPTFPKNAADLPEEYEEPEHGELTINADYIVWEHPYGAYPTLKTNLIANDSDELYFDFCFQYPKKAPVGSATDLMIQIDWQIEYGTSAYPLMVFHTLQEKPQSQEEIAENIFWTYETKIERKAVGRHLKLLESLGFPIAKNKDGYYLSEEAQEPNLEIKYTSRAYPLLILNVLTPFVKTQADIIRAVQEKYGTKIDRKTVSKHLKLLAEFGWYKRNL